MFSVLPLRIAGKLIFCLCHTCADLNQSIYKHCEQERCLQEMWTSIKVQKPLEHGYKIIKVYEVYDLKKKGGNIFKDYINTFLQVKQESSGMLPDCLNSVSVNEELVD